MSSFHVLIAGGGIGGLCLAQGLKKAGISCAVHEAAPGIVRTGYRLHMNATGGGALKECLPENLYELYMQTSRITPRREVFVMLDSQCEELGARPHIGPPNDPDRPHTAVNRRTLRQIMHTGLEDIVHFGHTVTGYEEDGDAIRLLFADGTSAAGDVLVAADGLHSPVRRQRLPEIPTFDTGMRSIAACVPLTDDLVAMLPDALFDGFVLASSADGVNFSFGAWQPRRPVAEAVAELAPDADIDHVEPYMMVHCGFTEGSPYLAGIPDLWSAGPEELHPVMREAVRDWHPAVVELVERVDLSTVAPMSVRRLEPVDAWETGRVTFLGDAIHAMPPSFGSGANTALRDAASLAGALDRAANGDGDLLREIAAYEEGMRAEVWPIFRASADPRSFSQADFLPDDVPVAGR
ncbi:NAD(P)/FAD-dependent oxidoreductase [Streptomyces luomodiensis]|uniref:NAD(P)/FAD-dependent oxidoreductase n=2 Tax=Streptomyces luomodiensis TaxID=3026192 RepID=A0ABY9UN43_9ACTN|nr:NAD(P)/FAD-dependent oxidoreductase [Streptomyces sp. SCA4-21]WNE93965.1 NAD(P)/FAD-dependent oxidoreductase [Streptomyces sp. SCA4-21]